MNYQNKFFLFRWFLSAFGFLSLTYFNFWFWWDRSAQDVWWGLPTIAICFVANVSAFAAVVAHFILAGDKRKD